MEYIKITESLHLNKNWLEEIKTKQTDKQNPKTLQGEGKGSQKPKVEEWMMKRNSDKYVIKYLKNCKIIVSIISSGLKKYDKLKYRAWKGTKRN